MKSVLLKSLNQFELLDRPEPVCGPDEVILEPQSVAICGSDVRIYRYGNSRVNIPTVIGHEVAAIVAEVGKDVKHLKAGDRVVIGADVPDMDSGKDYTLRGLGNLCPENYAIGYQLEGAFQQKMKLNNFTVRYGPIVKIPDSLSFDEACLAEPLACAIHGLELAQMALGKSICVIGLGPIGCMILELSKVFGASNVFAAQRSKKRLEMARSFLPEARFIATEEENLVETILNETNGEGVDLVITTAGTTQAQTDAIQIVKKRGYVNLFAGLKNQPQLTIDSNLIHYKECFVMGSHGSTRTDMEKAIQLLAQGSISARKYISRTFPLSQIEAAFQYHESRAGMKAIIKPQQYE